MPSQIVFLLDLDACVPLCAESVLRECLLGLLRSESHGSLLSVLLKTDLPSFSVRFYSSTGFFGGGRLEEEEDAATAGSYAFRELSKDSLSSLERLLEDRLSSLGSVFEREAWERHPGHKGGSLEPLSSALDALSRHMTWDRPLLSSPLKKKDSRRNGNPPNSLIYLLTSLPGSKADYKARFHPEAKSYTSKELADRLFTKTTLQRLRQEVALYIVDMGRNDAGTEIRDLFQKTLKSFRMGGILPFDSLRMTSLVPFIQHLQTIKGLKAHTTSRMKLAPGGKEIPSSMIRQSETCSPLGEGLKIIGMVSKELLAREWEGWEAHSGIRMGGSVAFWKAMGPERALLVALEGTLPRLGVVFQNGILSVLSPERSKAYLQLWNMEGDEGIREGEEESRLIHETVDQVLSAECTTPLEDPMPKNTFSDVDLETWRLGDEAPAFTKRLREVKKPPWVALLSKAYAAPRKDSRGNESHLMERNDSGFSEGKRSSSSLTRRLSDESNSTRRRGAPIASRAAELLRLGNQRNAENKRRRRSQNKPPPAEPFSFPFNDLRAMKRLAYEKEMSEAHEVSQILALLMEFQIDVINDGDSVAMSALAEITISSLLKQLTLTGEVKTKLVPIVADNFLVDPLTISRRKTNKKMPKRLRDHMLQVLYRMELHWLLPSSKDQEKFENEILIHLRQISIWGSLEDMVAFLNDALTPMYVDRQPELLCSLYDELNQPKAEALRGIFSPSAKSDCSSLAPSSVLSQSSEASQYSSKNPSLRSYNNNKSVANLRKLKRPHSFDNGHMRQIAHPQLKTTASVLAKKPTYNIIVKEKSLPALSASPSSKGRSGLHRAKRNLSFDGMGGKSSPRKKPSTPRKKAETPKKKLAPLTPKRMTPNKTHHIYAPETPVNKLKHHRKSDGLLTVHESPDIDSLKTAKTTPRRMRASLNLHRKTSFYSGDVSRNLMKAEENVNACKIRRTSSFSQPFLDESSCDSTAGYLFQNIIRKRGRPEEEEEGEGNSRHKIRRIEPSHDEEDTMDDVFSEPSTSPMKTPKKRFILLGTPLKNSPSPSKKVQFNMRHQPPTPSRGTPAKTILKTPCKEPKTPTSRSLSASSPLVSVSARKKRILFGESPSKPRLLVPCTSSSSTKKKIDFEEREVEIPDCHLANMVLMSKASSDQELPPLLASEEVELPPPPKEPTTPIPEASFSPPSQKEKHPSPPQEEKQSEDDRRSLSVLQPLPLDNNEPENSSSAPLMKRGGRSRKATHRFGIDDVPLMCTPSPVRSSNVKSSASKGGSGIRRNLFTPEGGADENKARRASLRRTKLQDSDEDDPELDEDFHIRRKRTTRKKPKKRVLTMMEVDEPVETVVDGFGDASKEDEEQKSQGDSPIKHWAVTNISESPRGEIKLKINRTPKNVTQRISRSLVSEIGVSPDRLRRILTDTPSPKKKSVKEESAAPTSQKYSPLSSMSLIQLTTSPILDKSKPSQRNRKVNKRLYID